LTVFGAAVAIVHLFDLERWGLDAEGAVLER